jgi:hypothetical protein
MRTVIPKRALALPAVLLIVFLLFATPAGADIGEKIILRCTHGESLRGFSQKDYSKALKELETSLEEYSGCASLIHQAQLAAAGTRGGSSGGGGGSAAAGATSATAPATPAERNELNSAPRAGSTPQQVGNQLIRPGVVHADIASALSSLPNPLLAILAFLLACTLALAGGEIRNRVRNRHHN